MARELDAAIAVHAAPPGATCGAAKCTRAALLPGWGQGFVLSAGSPSTYPDWSSATPPDSASSSAAPLGTVAATEVEVNALACTYVLCHVGGDGPHRKVCWLARHLRVSQTTDDHRRRARDYTPQPPARGFGHRQRAPCRCGAADRSDDPHRLRISRSSGCPLDRGAGSGFVAQPLGLALRLVGTHWERPTASSRHQPHTAA